SNAMHVELPERVDFISIDASWTKQDKLLPNVDKLLKSDGVVVTLIKPHYEADPKRLRKGILPPEEVEPVVDIVRTRILACGFTVEALTTSPILGGQGNTEVLALLRRGR
ncbi:MAG: hypothetical protein JWM57_3279, partial [Phycisphaerales bacterium]|nr:hypothetical protein [Phycisphaerales bacterium]